MLKPWKGGHGWMCFTPWPTMVFHYFDHGHTSDHGWSSSILSDLPSSYIWLWLTKLNLKWLTIRSYIWPWLIKLNLKWLTMVSHLTMIDHGKPSSNLKWLTMVLHLTMIDHGKPSSNLKWLTIVNLTTMFILPLWPW